MDSVEIEAVKIVPGPISAPIMCFKIKQQSGPKVRVGIGSVGFKITLDGKTIVNLGDSIFQDEWAGLKPDLLMLPIGGMGNNTWTMDLSEALEAVRLIAPKRLLRDNHIKGPWHYNVPFFLIKNIVPADDQFFKREVDKLGIECNIIQYGDEIEV